MKESFQSDFWNFREFWSVSIGTETVSIETNSQ